uniref:SGNH/GDSL hydrolase family protein n=1 Tax=uncultured Draconibacterium sp. TaxID=1573823 RepID=UPI003217B6CA
MKKQNSIVILFCLLLWATAGTLWAQNDKSFFPANNDAFTYMGRIQHDNETVKYNWPGVTVLTRFTGKELGIKIKGGESNYFNVWIDDKPEQVVYAVNDTIWWYPEKLSKGNHQLRIVKRTEGNMGMAEFSGIYVGRNEHVMKVPPLSPRKILFIGNSITCGYGTEGKNKSERFKPSTENCEKSYATIMARAFGAQYHLISHSGLGMVRNYGDKQKISTQRKPMPARLEYLFDENPDLKYDLQNYIPDVVVINLGTNDFSTLPHPDENAFVTAGKRLITKLKQVFPQTKIVCITGPMTNEPCYTYTKKIVEQIRVEQQTQDIVFVGIPVNLLNSETDLGSDHHPSYQGQLKSAQIIIPVLGSILNWNYSLNEILEQLNN